MQSLTFVKMHGLGNDFMVLDTLTQTIHFDAVQIRQWADRHYGIGFDQLLVIQAAQQANTDFFCRFFNADGSEAEQCGNGLRCITQYIYQKNLATKTSLQLATINGLYTAQMMDKQNVCITIHQANFQIDPSPVILRCQGRNWQGTAVSVGNPHVVFPVVAIEQAPVKVLGNYCNLRTRFKQGVNVEFMQCISKKMIKLRVFERGVGETLACGSGACAAVIVGQQHGCLAHQVTVSLPGGDLQVTRQNNGSIQLSGATQWVYEGRLTV